MGRWVFRLTSQGETSELGRLSAPGPALRRRVWLHRLHRRWAELAFYPAGHAILTREGEGAIGQVSVPATSEVEWAAHLRLLGFCEVSAWSESATRLTGRELRARHQSALELVRLSVDGQTCVEASTRIEGANKTSSEQRTPHAERALAIEAAERRLFELEQQGFELNGTFAYAGTGEALAEPPPVALSEWVRPPSPHLAVDAAVARLRELHERFPAGHLVVELLDPALAITRNARGWIDPPRGEPPPAELDRLEDLGHDAFFREQHAARFGRWLSASTAPSTAGSSFEYFVERYGTLTWVVEGVGGGFYSGNVSGGGSCVLELDPNEYELSDLAKSLDPPVPGLAQALVFHGGWHDGNSFMFDRRSRTATGEWGIFPFSEGEPELPAEPLAPDDIVPFGHWLFDRVEALCARVVPYLRSVQGPRG